MRQATDGLELREPIKKELLHVPPGDRAAPMSGDAIKSKEVRYKSMINLKGKS